MTDSWTKKKKKKENSATKKNQSSFFKKKDFENCNKWFSTQKTSEFWRLPWQLIYEKARKKKSSNRYKVSIPTWYK